jgi:dCTP deaminase
MTVLSDTDLKRALRSGEIKIEPQPAEDQIGAGSIDVALSNEFYVLKASVKKGKIHDLKEIQFEDLFEQVTSDAIILKPNELVLAKTLEKITLAPNICGWIQGRSRYARLGITAHVASSFIQPGSDNHQILEIVNLSPIQVRLHAGMRICQIIFERTENKAVKPYSKFGKFSKQ